MQEGFDLVGHILHSVPDLTDSTLDSVHYSADDVSAPLEGLRGQSGDPVYGRLESVHDRVLDVADGGGDALPYRGEHAGDDIPQGLQNRCDDVDDSIPHIGDERFHILP